MSQLPITDCTQVCAEKAEIDTRLSEWLPRCNSVERQLNLRIATSSAPATNLHNGYELRHVQSGLQLPGSW
jgi:hypothetical protein